MGFEMGKEGLDVLCVMGRGRIGICIGRERAITLIEDMKSLGGMYQHCDTTFNDASLTL